ncbi:TetR/AcrR family transcriptional regulator [Domibacillus sp. A3M-37]|uniref:TetR/AcrR family transcriptional regulator n=1 Tax=Domibacillus sp. A3M-37 TaxID=2962037 RepID=UPI0020B88221|nr:TetR/AcrR family transcriptional regulator [Domibacillus sp. A3M-37]MCP3764750.1 TetR/AcrR family transcriptional regulator [Domibacillus sp. A3M-37]
MKKEEKLDRRQIRTKKLIRQALLELSEEKGLSQVTVRDLAERAEINRGTFYLHYRDVADLVDQLKSEIFEGILPFASEINPLEVKSHAERGEPYPVLLKVLEYFLAQADFLRVMLSANGDLQLPLQIKEFMSERMLQKFEQYMPEKSEDAIPWDYFVAYIASANIGVLTHWMASENDLSTREVALMMTRIITQGPLETVLGGVKR